LISIIDEEKNKTTTTTTTTAELQRHHLSIRIKTNRQIVI